MTKQVRVENADTAEYKVAVQVWSKGAGEEPDVLIEEKTLDYPAQLGEFHIWKGRYLVVKEAD
ncbi:MAG: hypothetical protein WBQ05_16570 [Candidatus Competibacter denitrificans]